MKIFNLLYKTLICVAFVGGLSSCVNNWLDESPYDSTDASGAISSSTDLNTARIGMYAILRGNSTLDDYYAARMIYYGDVRGEDMQAVSGGGGRSTVSYNMTWTTPTNAPDIWQTPYIVIERANNIIKAAESGTLSDESTAKSEIDQCDAEAKVVRAMAHFDLVRVYGNPYTMDSTSLGIPVVSSVLEPTAQEGRNTVAEVYKQVISDLTSAINSGALQTTLDDGYINVWAAKALLTRVYLTKGDNQAALNVAEDIISNSPYTLWTHDQYVNAWDKNNSVHTNEAIFEFLINNSSYWTDREGIAYLYDESGYNDAVATKSFIGKAKADDPNDVRLGTILLPKDSANIKMFTDSITKVTYPVYINKYRNDGGDVRMADVVLLRLSEVYLSAAEAAYKLGDKTTAAKYLDAIVNRADPVRHATASSITLTQILWERRKELIGEGQRFFDAMRNNETIVRYTGKADRGWNAPLDSHSMSYDRTYYKALLPIPQAEIDANSVIAKQQNPEY
jgi:starch-binding outer membrane protein, SusD/RagB family